MIETAQAPQRALLFGTDRPEMHIWGDEPLAELERLVQTAGAVVAAKVIQRCRTIHPGTYIGRGKAEQIRQAIADCGADMAVFDEELSPSQARNLEELFEVQVIDRTGLILDIFAQHARTNEARLQVELAQLEYLLPRLKRMWVHLSRIRGGIGLRGPGETQLETDRQMLQRRISSLRAKLEKIARQRDTRRTHREGMLRLALVGYTNSGKSSILAGLTGCEVVVRDQLFSTLDTTTRKLELAGGQEVLITDTVGFINHLPHNLVASFKATLEEVCEADHLLVVVDAANAHFQERIKVVEGVLEEIGAGGIEHTLVFNKIDLLPDSQLMIEIAEHYPGAVFTSAISGESGLRNLVGRITRLAQAEEAEFSIEVPAQDGKLMAALHSQGQVIEQSGTDDQVRLRVRMRRHLIERLLRNTPYLGQITYHGGRVD